MPQRESHHPDPDVGPCPPVIGVIAVAMLVSIIATGLVLIATAIDWRAVIDFASPTAAQAREAGWAAMTERTSW